MKRVAQREDYYDAIRLKNKSPKPGENEPFQFSKYFKFIEPAPVEETSGNVSYRNVNLWVDFKSPELLEEYSAIKDEQNKYLDSQDLADAHYNPFSRLLEAVIMMGLRLKDESLRKFGVNNMLSKMDRILRQLGVEGMELRQPYIIQSALTLLENGL